LCERAAWAFGGPPGAIAAVVADHMGLMMGCEVRQLGHASTAMVFKAYARWIEGADKGAEAAKANAILSSNRPRDAAA
jgi:hypothetical protein